MKAHHVRFGQLVRTATGTWQRTVAALVISPIETLMLSGDGTAPGERLDPALWQAAAWDYRRQCWIVPAAPLPDDAA